MPLRVWILGRRRAGRWADKTRQRSVVGVVVVVVAAQCVNGCSLNTNVSIWKSKLYSITTPPARLLPALPSHPLSSSPLLSFLTLTIPLLL